MRVRELRVVYTKSSQPQSWPRAKGIHTARDAATILVPILEHEVQEVFGVLVLSTKHTLIGYQEVHRGTLDNVSVHARDVFRAALLLNASGIVLAHNHPSADPTPSADDIAMTRQLVAAGELLGVEILDHIIVGEKQYVSFKETGRL